MSESNAKVKNTPERAAAKNQEGLLLMQAGDLQRAVDAFTAAIELDPRLHVAYRRRASALRKLGRIPEAEADSKKADSIIGGAPPEESLEKSPFRTAFVWTAVAIAAPSLVSVVGVVDDGFYSFWYAGGVAWVVALAAATGLAIRHKEEATGGVLAGFGVGTLVIVVTWFTNTFTA